MSDLVVPAREGEEVVVELVECDEVDEGAHQVVVLSCPSFNYARDEGREEHNPEDFAHGHVDSGAEQIEPDAREHDRIDGALETLSMCFGSPKSSSVGLTTNGRC